MVETAKADKKGAKGRIEIDAERCKGCQICLTFCPKKVIGVSKQPNQKGYYPAMVNDPEGKCNGCAICALCCPDVAIEVYRD